MRETLLAGAETVPRGQVVTGWTESLAKTGIHLINKPNSYRWKTKIFYQKKNAIGKEMMFQKLKRKLVNPTVPSWILPHFLFISVATYWNEWPKEYCWKQQNSKIFLSGRWIGSNTPVFYCGYMLTNWSPQGPACSERTAFAEYVNSASPNSWVVCILLSRKTSLLKSM